MANWEKLNKEFDDLIDNMSQEDWKHWDANRAARRELRKANVLIKAKIRERLMNFEEFVGQSLETGTIPKSPTAIHSMMICMEIEPGESTHAMAA